MYQYVYVHVCDYDYDYVHLCDYDYDYDYVLCILLGVHFLGSIGRDLVRVRVHDSVRVRTHGRGRDSRD